MDLSEYARDHSVEAQSATNDRISRLMLTDPELQFAQELELPTFTVDGASWYYRLTLVARGGTIDKAFFPISSAARSAAQVVA
jgi:hypothetical protein